jgi:hypothetical protein
MGLSYFLLLRASELYAYDDSKKIHGTFGLTRSNLTFLRQGKALSWAERKAADLVKVCIPGSKTDQERIGHTLVRYRQSEGRMGALELLQALLDEQDLAEGDLPEDLPLAAVWKGSKWEAVTRKQAVAELRFLVKVLGENEKEYALHSFRIGAATAMAAAGMEAYVIMREGRWKTDTFMVYVQAVLADSRKVSEILASQRLGASMEGAQWWEAAAVAG